MSPQPATRPNYPARMRHDALARYLNEVHEVVGEVDDNFDECLGWCVDEYVWWCLVELPIESVANVGRPNSWAKAERYAQLLTPAPPIVAIEYPDDRVEIVDGFHRIAAAQERHDATIWAYLPCRVEQQKITPHSVKYGY